VVSFFADQQQQQQQSESSLTHQSVTMTYCVTVTVTMTVTVTRWTFAMVMTRSDLLRLFLCAAATAMRAVRCIGHALYENPECGNKHLQLVRMLSPQKAVCVGADQSFTAFIMI
jgi:hypothetical protein